VEEWADEAVGWAFNGGGRGLRCRILCALIAIPACVYGQYRPLHMTMNHGEEITYEVCFKWGILMASAGEGRLTFNKTTYNGAASKYRLTFQSNKFFDSIYKIRDTIDCYYAPDHSLLYNLKRTSEGGYELTDELRFSYHASGQTTIHSLRYTPEKIKIDTTLTVTSGYVSDMLGAIFFLRTQEWKNIKPGVVFPLTIAIGRDLVKTSFRYQGTALIEQGGATLRAHHFYIDIYDAAFMQSKAAAELWVSDDENHIPLKVRSKLKIGYAEIYYKHSRPKTGSGL
jgi:hypothetical protein